MKVGEIDGSMTNYYGNKHNSERGVYERVGRMLGRRVSGVEAT